jgi:F420-dependent oxidoreductase-like protein
MRVAIGLRLETNEDWAQASDYVTEAERLGVDFVWSHESWGLDAVTPLAFMAARTSRIRLGSGIMQAGTRTPALTAMTAMSLASMSNGRFALGLGVSGPQVIEGWHGLPFDRPVTRMRETVEIVRLALRGERVAYRGQVYELPLPGGEGKALRSSASPRPDVPIYLATLSPRSLEMTGEIADGWLGTSFMPDHARVFFDDLEVGARAGRSASSTSRRAAPSPLATTWSGSSPRASRGWRSPWAPWARASTTSTTTPSGAPATRTRPARSSACGWRGSARRQPPASPTTWP